MTHDDPEDSDPELAEFALQLRELESDQEQEPLFPDAFMQEFTDFTTWDEFKLRLAATPRAERKLFMLRATRFTSYEDMERVALERSRVARAQRALGGEAVPGG